MSVEEELNDDIEQLEKQVAMMEKELEEGRLEEQGLRDAVAKDGEETTSVYVGQVDYSAAPEELHAHFEGCGTVKRVTILCDKFTGHPKGYAYMEFEDEEAVEKAVELNGSEFKGRQLKVFF